MFVFLSLWGPVLQNASALFKKGHAGATRSPQQKRVSVCQMWRVRGLLCLSVVCCVCFFVCVWIRKRELAFMEVCFCECVVAWLSFFCVCVCVLFSASERLITLFTVADRSSFSLKVPVYFSWTLDYPAYSYRVYWSHRPKWSNHLFMHRTKALPGAVLWQTVPISLVHTTMCHTYPFTASVTHSNTQICLFDK